MTSTRTATRAGIALMGAAVLALVGCASDGDPGGGDDASGEGSTLQQAQESGTITLAIASERPYSWVDESGQPTGATIAMHEHIFSALGIDNIEVEEVAWDSLIPGLNAGRWDVISAGMSILPERCAEAAFSDPEIMYTTTLAVPAGNPNGLTDLDSVAATDGEVTLAVQSGAIEAGYAQELGIANTIEVDTAQAGIEAVQSGRADAFALTAVSLNWMTEDLDNVETTEAFVQVIDGVEQIGAGATVFRQGDTDLLEAYNAELANITSDEQTYLGLVEPFGFTAENLPPEDLTTEQLCSGELE
ncbi:ABC transporter substrate-binding protein [Pseudoclavibacter endophyticus]|uniref:Transporter substrate-binding domain-containing protein n=1 Tax=Pseudoclavibacter endophyticus TaxID=1778590 RepID=A0A6H9WQZ1_9MICO|nr:transporter substrate-binding domain-containing protein [Pseudoclavibacter endophyticus]KAB1649367.1 transporter substrate-binding domain-containing protein [Pseudoclavibacter endophyticus]GGA63155.1 ABC transporter substrate-binding protein [Pseudoclavibacter endophyticus]